MEERKTFQIRAGWQVPPVRATPGIFLVLWPWPLPTPHLPS